MSCEANPNINHSIIQPNEDQNNQEVRQAAAETFIKYNIAQTENTEQKGQIIQLTTDISLIRNHIGI